MLMQPNLPHTLPRAFFSRARALVRWSVPPARLQVPPWVRIYRIQRDIPMPLVTSGVEKGNLRELALARMAGLGLRCRCVGVGVC